MIRLCDKTDCTGCGACYNACPKRSISMEKDVEGFLYPRIDTQTCVECGACQMACPVLTPLDKHRRAEYPLAVVAVSDEIRRKSSSGGMFSLFSSSILSCGGIVYGAAFDKDYRVCHRSARDEKELEPLRGSKYAQSDVELTFREVRESLRVGRDVLYTGTPCQIAGLYRFLGKRDVSRLYTVDLVCHGVPSVKSFQLYLSRLAEKLNIDVHEIEDFRFRELEGWGYAPSFQFAKAKGRHLLESRENLYMRLFLSSRLHRPSCYHCRYATPERISDITIADFWGIGKSRPYGWDVSSGCSLVLKNTDKGRELFSGLSSAIYSEERDWDEALRNNTQLHTVSPYPKDRDEAFHYLSHYDYDTIYNHFFNTPYLRLRRIAGNLLRRLHLR
ncbi:Coenzyme F420 hydrogenase/dehydrogenase, beta subunit C-terminal domain [Parabacteroides distasonis]|uniref:Coenzyme F420 hydrogenase/dehydrogenase, beta subunit C-terminal domain n=1 Tax=Parabacteroides distasonis TaxID=823 RepID=UPI003F24A3AA